MNEPSGSKKIREFLVLSGRTASWSEITYQDHASLFFTVRNFRFVCLCGTVYGNEHMMVMCSL